MKDDASIEKIRDNIRIGQIADTIYMLACDEAETLQDPEQKTRFWKVLAALATDRVPKASPPSRDEPMTDEESRSFEGKRMLFGKYEGFPISQIPIEYLEWLADQKVFYVDVVRYLTSKRIATERIEE